MGNKSNTHGSCSDLAHDAEMPLPVLIDIDTVAKMATALDSLGAEIVSLPFETLDEACSEEFQEYVINVVRAVTGCLVTSETELHDDSSSKVFRKPFSPSNPNDQSFIEIWKEVESALFEIEEKERTSADANLALAIALQEQDKSSAAGDLSTSSRSIDFPPLPRSSQGRTREEPNVERPRHKKKHNFRDSDDADAVSPRTMIAIASSEDFPLEAMGYRQRKDQKFQDAKVVLDRRHDDYAGFKKALLMSHENYSDRSKQSHAFSGAHQERESSPGDRAHGKNQRPPTSSRMVLVECRTSSGPEEMDSHADDLTLAEHDHHRHHVQRKKFRKVAHIMLKTGWYPLKGRGGGHYMYERIVTREKNRSDTDTEGMRQILVLPSTPSDIRAIDILQARLRRLDREAAEFQNKRKEK